MTYLSQHTIHALSHMQWLSLCFVALVCHLVSIHSLLSNHYLFCLMFILSELHSKYVPFFPVCVVDQCSLARLEPYNLRPTILSRLKDPTQLLHSNWVVYRFTNVALIELSRVYGFISNIIRTVGIGSLAINHKYATP